MLLTLSSPATVIAYTLLRDRKWKGRADARLHKKAMIAVRKGCTRPLVKKFTDPNGEKKEVEVAGQVECPGGAAEFPNVAVLSYLQKLVMNDFDTKELDGSDAEGYTDLIEAIEETQVRQAAEEKEAEERKKREAAQPQPA